jgi:hypothetical protein
MATKKVSTKSDSSKNPNKDFQTGMLWLNINPEPKKGSGVSKKTSVPKKASKKK